MSGRPFLQIPGPTNVPDRVLRAMDREVIDHRSPAFGTLVRGLLPDLARVFKTERGRVIVYPTSGTGAWEASLVNVLAPGRCGMPSSKSRPAPPRSRNAGTSAHSSGCTGPQ